MTSLPSLTLISVQSTPSPTTYKSWSPFVSPNLFPHKLHPAGKLQQLLTASGQGTLGPPHCAPCFLTPPCSPATLGCLSSLRSSLLLLPSPPHPPLQAFAYAVPPAWRAPFPTLCAANSSFHLQFKSPLPQGGPSRHSHQLL